MAFKGFVLFVVMVLVANMITQNEAQSGCTTTLTNLSPCLNYIVGNSSTPSTSCCSQLSTVVQSSPKCLCFLLNGGGSSFGITINQTLALSLPVACKVQTPLVSQCKGKTSPSSSTSPVASPIGSPATESPQGKITPSATDFPSGGGSKTVPSTEGGSSDGSTIKVSFHFVLSLLTIVFSVVSKF